MPNYDNKEKRRHYARKLHRLTAEEKIAAFLQWADQCGYRDRTIDALRAKAGRKTLGAVAHWLRWRNLDGVARHLEMIVEQDF